MTKTLYAFGCCNFSINTSPFSLRERERESAETERDCRQRQRETAETERDWQAGGRGGGGGGGERQRQSAERDCRQRQRETETERDCRQRLRLRERERERERGGGDKQFNTFFILLLSLFIDTWTYIYYIVTRALEPIKNMTRTKHQSVQKVHIEAAKRGWYKQRQPIRSSFTSPPPSPPPRFHITSWHYQCSQFHLRYIYTCAARNAAGQLYPALLRIVT